MHFSTTDDRISIATAKLALVKPALAEKMPPKSVRALVRNTVLCNELKNI